MPLGLVPTPPRAFVATRCSNEGITIMDFDGSAYGTDYLQFKSGQPLVMKNYRAVDGGWAWGSLGPSYSIEGWFPPSYWSPTPVATYPQTVLDSESKPHRDRTRARDTEEFLSRHGLEDWMGIVLDSLSDAQRRRVMGPQIKNADQVRNLHHVILSRVMDAAPVAQRLDMFAKMNGLDENVLRELRLVSPALQDLVMQWPKGCKISNAGNPSGVVVARLRSLTGSGRCRSAAPRHMPEAIAAVSSASQLAAQLSMERDRADAAEQALEALRDELWRLRRENAELRLQAGPKGGSSGSSGES
eukprot:CAMPEP_0179105738 /NCGR_PEP_ID=MMETSP0796-20121207/49121_1 /TAXON_ID=73915 /ORGANISM="Pyrodinium bahamense, Strain pbaha01" /LENGTH=300 /DNA_ID=CAMNT_0020803731 /DNA_START=92 /DNA_END=994 /DNA_ORIENTATION=-